MTPPDPQRDTGAAGLAVRPYKPRCHFGRAHSWVADPHLASEDEETYQCWDCGAVSSNHPANREASK